MLSDEDGEALTRALIRDMSRGGDRQTFEAVEAIVARHVAAALNEVADEIERELICCDVFERLHKKRAIDHTQDQKAERRMHSICYWGEAAARIVRAAIPKPPTEPADPLVRPAGRTPGTT